MTKSVNLSPQEAELASVIIFISYFFGYWCTLTNLNYATTLSILFDNTLFWRYKYALNAPFILYIFTISLIDNEINVILQETILVVFVYRTAIVYLFTAMKNVRAAMYIIMQVQQDLSFHFIERDIV